MAETTSRNPWDYVCLAQSPDGFICNMEPKHDGDHVAYAGTERIEVDRWENKSSPLSELPHDVKQENG